MSPLSPMKRREFLRLLALSAAATSFPCRELLAATAQTKPNMKKIPSTGVLIPTIGMGTWITFNVGNDQKARDARTEVLKEFFASGGRVIDSSPMYGSSEAVVGHALSKAGQPPGLFTATKVWTEKQKEGEEQIKESLRLWGVKKLDLLQVHNLLGWEAHLKTLFAMKEKRELKYVGVTTSHGRRHDELEKIMRSQPLDFVQLTYNIQEREAERRLLPLAQERNIAVIANRPFEGGELVKRLKGKPLPPWAPEIGCKTWPELLLKFIVSHPAVTCAIPATSKVAHMKENMAAARGALPDAAARERMVKYFSEL